MNALDSVPLDTLSDSDAVSLLFDLTGHGEDGSGRLLQLDNVVYQRLLQTYQDDASPLPQANAT